MKKELLSYNNLFNYYLIQSKNRIKTIVLRFMDNNIYVYAPLWIDISVINKFLEKNEEKILNYLEKHTNTDRFLYLGEEYRIVVIENKLLKKYICNLNKEQKVLYIYKTKGSFDLFSVLNKWKKEILMKLIQKRIEYFILQYKFNFNPKINRISIKNMISKWGSCSIQHNLNFNLNLLERKMDIIDYVVVHELVHTINFNHSKDFWDNVSKIIPNYIELRNELKAKY